MTMATIRMTPWAGKAVPVAVSRDTLVGLAAVGLSTNSSRVKVERAAISNSSSAMASKHIEVSLRSFGCIFSRLHNSIEVIFDWFSLEIFFEALFITIAKTRHLYYKTVFFSSLKFPETTTQTRYTEFQIRSSTRIHKEISGKLWVKGHCLNARTPDGIHSELTLTRHSIINQSDYSV
jgi:hypothetical protein